MRSATGTAAQPDMLQALALSPNQPYVLNYLGYSWALRGEKLDKAQAMLQEAAGLDPNDGAVIDSLGYVDLRQGRYQGRRSTLLTQAVELDPDDAEVNAHLGDAFWQAGGSCRRITSGSAPWRCSRTRNCGRKSTANCSSISGRPPDALGFAPAKVNLFLHVTGKRADGYHLLDSLAVFPAVGDEVGAAAGGRAVLAHFRPVRRGVAGGGG